jgi:hypothetical protein
MKVDSLTLYAYADKSQMHERELWKKFLLLLLPILLEAEVGEIEEIFDEAVLDSPEEVVASATSLHSAPELVRVISGTLALALGLPAEFGLSAFLEGNPPTRVLAPSAKALKVTDEELMSRWLGRFSSVQYDDDFLQMAADWKERLHALLQGAANAEALALAQANENAEVRPSASQVDGKPKSTARNRRPRKGTPVPEEPGVETRVPRKRSA